MTDRELLEAAAKAAGLKIEKVLLHADGSVEQFQVASSKYGVVGWNPLAAWGGGEALSLAVGLRLDIVHGAAQVWVGRANPPEWLAIVSRGEDGDAATRRAVVQAAAEIGKAML